jgi:hypothetical protein
MRLILIEGEGEEARGSMYSLDWLRERVRWHLDPGCCIGAVFVVEAADGAIAGHTIVRVAHDAQGRRFGLVSTPTSIRPTGAKGWRKRCSRAANSGSSNKACAKPSPGPRRPTRR